MVSGAHAASRTPAPASDTRSLRRARRAGSRRRVTVCRGSFEAGGPPRGRPAAAFYRHRSGWWDGVRHRGKRPGTLSSSSWHDEAGMVALQAIPPPFTPLRLITGWDFAPVPMVLILLAGFLYWAGLRRLARAARGPGWPASRPWAFGGGLAVTAVALVSPVDTYARVSFSIHMAQHVLLMMAAAPLFALGAPITLALRASRVETRRRVLLPILHSRAVAFLT